MDHCDQNDQCPCSSGKIFSECCSPVIEGEIFAASPEALMRARYTAHALGKTKFLYQSLHPSIREEVGEEKELETVRSNISWDGLEIIETKVNGNEGEVDFIANYSIQGIAQKHRELAKFGKEPDNNWYYLDGEVEGHVTFKRENPKVGRNDPCPCGSGKKFKKCCGAN